MEYFCWLRVKSSNHLYTELNLGYLKGTKFCLESKASFIDISSIASFKPFLIAWLREYSPTSQVHLCQCNLHKNRQVNRQNFAKIAIFATACISGHKWGI